MKEFKIILIFSLLCCIVHTPQAHASELATASENSSESAQGAQAFLQAHTAALTTFAVIGSYYAYKGVKKLRAYCFGEPADQQYGALEMTPMDTDNSHSQAPVEDTQKTDSVDAFLKEQKQTELETILQEIKETEQLLPAIPDNAYGYLEAHILDDSKLASIGDLHGDWCSLNRDMGHMATTNLLSIETTENPFITDIRLKPGTELILTGDYIDRGRLGLCVLRALIHLLKLNPGHVHILRGNHESKDMAQSFGFYKELLEKFGSNAGRVMNAFDALFRRFPSAKVIGMRNHQTQKIDYVKYIHGGLEERLTGHFKELLAQVEAAPDGHAIVPFSSEDIKPVVNSPFKRYFCALQWGDFCATDYTEPQTLGSGRVVAGYGVFSHNKPYARRYMEQFDSDTHTMPCIVRGHKHDGQEPLGGVAQLNEQQIKGRSFTPMSHMQPCLIQQGSVFTLTSSPEGVRGLCKEDAFAVIENTPQGLQLTPYIWHH